MEGKAMKLTASRLVNFVQYIYQDTSATKSSIAARGLNKIQIDEKLHSSETCGRLVLTTCMHCLYLRCWLWYFL